MLKAVGIGVFAALLLSSGGLAQAEQANQPTETASELQSQYTDLDFSQCTVIESDDTGSLRACPGYKGIPVMVAEGDLRMFVSYGLTSTVEKAAEQTPPPFNRLGSKIEWRLSTASGVRRPIATILRYFTQRETGDTEGQVLVVTRIEPGATCQIAYIDALANPDANTLARQLADERAANFDCANEPEYIGKFSAWQR